MAEVGAAFGITRRLVSKVVRAADGAAKRDREAPGAEAA
jgi:hypothetical protein